MHFEFAHGAPARHLFPTFCVLIRTDGQREPDLACVTSATGKGNFSAPSKALLYAPETLKKRPTWEARQTDAMFRRAR